MTLVLTRFSLVALMFSKRIFVFVFKRSKLAYIWLVWKERNARIFNNKQISLKQLFKRVQLHFWWWLNAHNSSLSLIFIRGGQTLLFIYVLPYSNEGFSFLFVFILNLLICIHSFPWGISCIWKGFLIQLTFDLLKKEWILFFGRYVGVFL